MLPDPVLAESGTGGPAAPAGLPHFVQKRAPGTSAAPQLAQADELRDAPHDGQKLPVDSAPQLVHFIQSE